MYNFKHIGWLMYMLMAGPEYVQEFPIFFSRHLILVIMNTFSEVLSIFKRHNDLKFRGNSLIVILVLINELINSLDLDSFSKMQPTMLRF